MNLRLIIPFFSHLRLIRASASARRPVHSEGLTCRWALISLFILLSLQGFGQNYSIKYVPPKIDSAAMFQDTIKQDEPLELDELAVRKIVDDCFDKTLPTFPGGEIAMNKFLIDNMHYPDSALKYEEEGTVHPLFVVDTSGFIKDIKIMRGVSKEIDKEVIRVISIMPRWAPALCEKRKVTAEYVLPVKFIIH